jgi:hypothetical protein
LYVSSWIINLNFDDFYVLASVSELKSLEIAMFMNPTGRLARFSLWLSPQTLTIALF